MVVTSSTYSGVQKRVSEAKRGKKGSGKHRNLHGRMFPKASIRSFAVRHGAKRLSSTESNGVYEMIDSKLYNIIENVIYDAAIYTKAAGQTTIKESDVTKAIERLGGSALGLGSEASRRKL
jgi:histone H3/H4